jgi:superfamily II DNA or RNA helicase
MGTLGPNGLIVQSDPELKKELTVRPVENAMGIRPPSFKVWRSTGETMVVPRYFGFGRFGPPTADARLSPAPAGITFNGSLRTETQQDRAFAAGMEAFRTVGGGVLSLPPGFGKTAMALVFAAQLKVRTIIIVHKEFLANQWKERIAQFCPGATIGRIQQDTFDVEKDFVIAMIQTLCMREVGSLHQFGFLIVDEAHHIGAAAFSQSMFKICPKYTLGLTATPERKDGLTRLLYWFMGPEFYAAQRENQKKTKVIPVNFTNELYKEAPPMNKFGKVNMAGMVTMVSEIEPRNEVITDIIKDCLATGRRVLVLSDRREHCLWINSQFESKISGLYMGGMTETDLNVTATKPLIVATFAMAQEGLDIPALDTCILTSPHSDVTQAVGRIMRETAGKTNSPLIYDIVDQWSLFHAMYRKRLAFYKKAGFECGEDSDPAPLPVGTCAFL